MMYLNLVLFIFLCQTPAIVTAQTWSNKRIIYVSPGTLELTKREEVTIEFKLMSCVTEMAEDKNSSSQIQSSYRILSTLRKKGCILEGKFDYLDCEGKIQTMAFRMEIDAISPSQYTENFFPGSSILKVYPATLSFCGTDPAPPKATSTSRDNQTGNRPLTNSKSGNQSQEFYFFSVISVPVSKGIFHIYTEPILFAGHPHDFAEMKKTVANIYHEDIMNIYRKKAREELEKELKPQLKAVTEKLVDERIANWSTELQRNIAIFSSTVGHNRLALTVEESKKQIEEIVQANENALQGLQIDDPELNSLYPSTGKTYEYIHIKKEQKQNFNLRNKSGAVGVGSRG